MLDSNEWTGATEAALPLLTAIESERAGRFRFAQDRATYVLAHACWRVILGQVLGVPTGTVPLRIALAGQPMLPGTGFATSLSHSGNWVAVAIACATTVGLDIETSPARATLGQLAGSICTQAEIAALEELPAPDREPAMLALWTRKEALLKAFGCGLRTEPSSVSASPDEPVEPPLYAPVWTSCSVRNIELPATLVGALATPAATRFTSTVHRLEPLEGIDSAFCKAYAASRSLRI